MQPLPDDLRNLLRRGAGLTMQKFVHAFRGIGCTLREDANLAIHCVAAAGVFGLAAWLRLPATDWAILALTVGVVLAAEMLNTAIEKAVDLASPDYHELAGRAKDIAAGAVLVTTFAAVVVGACVFGPAVWERLGG